MIRRLISVTLAGCLLLCSGVGNITAAGAAMDSSLLPAKMGSQALAAEATFSCREILNGGFRPTVLVRHLVSAGPMLLMAGLAMATGGAGAHLAMLSGGGVGTRRLFEMPTELVRPDGVVVPLFWRLGRREIPLGQWNGIAYVEGPLPVGTLVRHHVQGTGQVIGTRGDFLDVEFGGGVQALSLKNDPFQYWKAGPAEVWKIFDNPKSDPKDKAAMARFLALQKSFLELPDLHRIISALIQSDDADVRSWLLLALQRSWTGVSSDGRAKIRKEVAQAVAQNRLESWTGTAILRPVLTGSTSNERVSSLSWDALDGPSGREALLRNAISRLQDKIAFPFLPLATVAAVLGRSPEELVHFVEVELGVPLAAYSLVGEESTPDLLAAASAALRRWPHERITRSELEVLMDLPKGDVIRTTERLSGSDDPAEAITIFGLFPEQAALARRLQDEWIRQADAEIGSPVIGRERATNKQGALQYRWSAQQGMLIRTPSARFQVPQERSPIFRLRVQEWIRTLAPTKEARRKMGVKDYTSARFQYHGRTISLTAFYRSNAKENPLGCSAQTYILMKYGFLKPLMPLSAITTVEDFAAYLAGRRSADDLRWDEMTPELPRLLVQSLSGETGKPPFWLARDDYSNVPIRRLSGLWPGQEPFTLARFYMHYRQEFSRRGGTAQTKRDRGVLRFILMATQLLPTDADLRHPIEMLSSPGEFKELLQQNWLGQVPWTYVKDSIRGALVQEFADAIGKRAAQLTLNDFKKPLPGVLFGSPESPGTRPFTLMGLYKLYAEEAERLGRSPVEWMAAQLGLEGHVPPPIDSRIIDRIHADEKLDELAQRGVLSQDDYSRADPGLAVEIRRSAFSRLLADGHLIETRSTVRRQKALYGFPAKEGLSAPHATHLLATAG